MDTSIQNFESFASPLRYTGWLSERSEPLQHWIVDNGRWVDVPAGKALFRESDRTAYMYGIETGAVDVEFAPPDLDELVTIRVGPGHWLGQSVLLPKMVRPFNLVAAVDSRVFSLSRNAVRAFLADQPEYWPEFYELALKQVIAMMSYLGETQWLVPEARIARQLLRLSVLEPVVELGQSELVALTGMSRSSVRRALGILTGEGMITTQYRTVEVLDRAGLEAVSRQGK